MLTDVHLQKQDGTDIGDIQVPVDGHWIAMPPDLAKEAVQLESGYSLKDLFDGRVVALIRIVNGKEAEFFVGTKEQSDAKMAEAPPGHYGARGGVHFDSYVLKADGTIER